MLNHCSVQHSEIVWKKGFLWKSKSWNMPITWQPKMYRYNTTQTLITWCGFNSSAKASISGLRRILSKYTWCIKESHYMTSVESQMRQTVYDQGEKERWGERPFAVWDRSSTLNIAHPKSTKTNVLWFDNFTFVNCFIWLKFYLVQCGKNTGTLRPCACQYCACNGSR